MSWQRWHSDLMRVWPKRLSKSGDMARALTVINSASDRSAGNILATKAGDACLVFGDRFSRGLR